MEVHRLEVLVIDSDEVGSDGVKRLIENTKYPNWSISPHVQKIETREVEWSDDHPLNKRDTADEAYRKLFEDDLARRCLEHILWSMGADDAVGYMSDAINLATELNAREGVADDL